jgi:hypothetical protein
LGLHPDKTRVVDLREGREGFVALANIVDTPHQGVCAHLAAPRSGRLFHRAIMQSSPCDREWSAEEHTAAPRARDTAER